MLLERFGTVSEHTFPKKNEGANRREAGCSCIRLVIVLVPLPVYWEVARKEVID